MLAIQTLGAPASRGARLRRRKPRRAPAPDDPAAVPITRLTCIRAEPLQDGAAAREWLRGLERDAEALEGEIAVGLAIANRALHSLSVASADAAFAQLGRSSPLAVRVGYGTGDEVVAGRWSEAVEAPRPRARLRRTDALRPTERVAAILGGRERPAACETLLLRARTDLDAGRFREAALELRGGVEALLAEVGASAGPRQDEDLAALGARRAELEAIAAAALRNDPSEAQRAALGDALGVAERVLRRRRILGA